MANIAFADLHGNLDVWRKIQARTSVDDRLYFLGDAADRGPDGYRILEEMKDDPRITYIKGNHDDMFVKGVLERDTDKFNHWICYCGGDSTYNAYLNEGSYETLDWLRSRPLREFLVTDKGLILLSHAGYTPRRNPLTTLMDDDFLWGRDHFFDSWALGDEDIYVVHGHTPVMSRSFAPWVHYQPEPVFYCDGHKVNIDVCTYFYNACVLLNLDDFTYEIVNG